MTSPRQKLISPSGWTSSATSFSEASDLDRLAANANLLGSLPREQQSLAANVATLPTAERTKRLKRLAPTESHRRLLRYDWRGFWARPKQIAPADWRWLFWLVCAGRGFGKTRTGAELVREWVGPPDRPANLRIALVGRTVPDVRDVMVMGQSGIVAVCPDWNKPKYEPSKRLLTWPNGAQATTYSADQPDQLRGPQHHKAWADELAAWRYEDAFAQLKFGLRLGSHPQCVITTTPRPTKIVRGLIEDSRDSYDRRGRFVPRTVHVTRGSSHENRGNVAATFLDEILRTYEGTRLGRQEIDAEILTDTAGALWKRDQLDTHRVRGSPALRTLAIAVDPAVSSGTESAETGIVVGGVGYDGQGYVLEDASGRYTPEEWAVKVVELFDAYDADYVVAEVNQGGDMVRSTLHTVRRTLPVRKVHASRGKRTRAEPVSALYEQGKIHHVGAFAELEDQLCDWIPDVSPRSPDRLDAVVWLFSQLMVKLNPEHGDSSELPEIQTLDSALVER